MEKTRKIKDGWHKVTEDYSVLTKDNGVVVKAMTTPKGRLGIVKSEDVYPMVQEGSLWINKIGRMNLNTLRQGIRRGNVRMMTLKGSE